MVVLQEVGRGIGGERGFPYGDGVIMKIGCDIPVCKSENIRENEDDYAHNKESEPGKMSSAELEEEQDKRIFFENTINYPHNPRNTVKECLIMPEDPYDEDMAEVKYLYSKPAAFIIIGKPSPDNMKFGKKLAAYWGCVYIDPITCFNAEPDVKESPALLWCRKYLLEGRSIPSEMVMRVMEQCALSDEAMHRGFVICGLPFAQQNGEPSAQEQMHMIFSWPFEPKIFIYISCPNADVVTKNNQMYFDTTTGNYINKNVFSIHKEVLLVYSHEPRISTVGSVTDDVYQENEQEKKLVAEDDVNHLVVLPEPYLQYILPRYQQAALPPVELYVAQVHPQYVIRVDGRTTPANMLKVVKTRLEALPIQPVCQPAPMLKQRKQHSKEQTGDEGLEGEPELEEQEEEEEMEGEEDEFPVEFGSLDEAYQELSVRDVVGIRYKWQKANWKFLCPVSLASGKIIEGDVKYSARFLNKMYFLSSPETLKTFMKNPRPYLLPPNPRPSCKIFMIGHNFSGKSTAAAYLAHAFQGQIINFASYTEEVELKETEEKERSIRDTIIDTKLKELNEEIKKSWSAAEEKRQKDIKIWQKQHLQIILQTVPPYDETTEVLEEMFPETMKEEAKKEEGPTINLSEPLLPQLSYARCRWLYKHPDELLKYLPPHLAFPTKLPPVPRTDSPEFIEYVDMNVKSTMEEEDAKKEPFPQRAGKILVDRIKQTQEELEAQTNGQKLDGGWVIDDIPLDQELWEYVANEGIIPEMVICLQDQSPEQSFLKEKKMAQLLEKALEAQAAAEALAAAAAAAAIAAAAAKEENGEEEGEWEGEKPMAEEEEEEQDYDKQEKQEHEEDEHMQQQFHIDIGPDCEEMVKYAEELTQFDEKWTSFQETINPTYPPIIVDVANKQLSDLMVEVGHRVQALYNVSAEPYTDEDRAEEKQLGQNLDEMENEEEETEEDTQAILKNRRMGETMIYCPVAYGSSRVLWKGKDDLLAKYKGKVYTFSNEDAMEKFMEKPWDFVKRHRPETFLPHLRICIVGPVGSGKTIIGKLLARSLGLFHKDLIYEINHTLIPKCKPLGRKVQYLEGRYIKDYSKHQEKQEGNVSGNTLQTRESEGDQINELEYEMTDAEAEMLQLRASIEQYLSDGSPMPEILVTKLLSPLWHDEPFQCNGFVLSGFPSCSEDIEVMKTHYFVPDVIIFLNIQNEEVAKERLLKEMKEFHEKEIAKQKRKAEKEQKRLQEALAAADADGATESLRLELESLLLSHLEKSLSRLDEQMPEGTAFGDEEEEYEGEGEEENNMRIQYEEDIQEWFMNDMEKVEAIKAQVEENAFNFLDINAGNAAQDVCLRIVHEIYPLKLRSFSSNIFEQTFPITFEEAEQLIKSGYYFLSRFGRWCPVQLATEATPISLYSPLIQKAQIFPVIHRRYIYFIGGQENLDLFQKDPMSYISKANPLPSIPIKIAITGPPKSGKSSLAKRLSRELNIKIITIGQAIRYVLENLSWTELALAVDDTLRMGETIPIKMALRCVEAVTMDHRSVTQGYVFDGFPISTDQIREMALLNLFPYLIISLDCQLLTCQARLQSEEAAFFSRTPIFSSKLLHHKYSSWYPTSLQAQRLLNAEYHNMETLDANHVMWWLYDKTTDHLNRVMKSISDYYSDITAGKPARLECMCITPEEFKDRQSKYLNYCPECLVKGHLNSGGTPPNKMGLVQYMVHYYWFCEKHLSHFMEKPTEFLSPTNKTELPNDLPHSPTEEDDSLELANDGYCIVTYVDSIPERILTKGLPEYAVTYQKKKYLFASAENKNKFMSNPTEYCDRKICMLPLRMPDMSILRFPTLGFLEQTISNSIHSALLGVGTERPKYPGLPLDLSAATYLGYYLKLINASTSEAQRELLLKAQEEFLHRCNILKTFCHRTKIRNPLLLYPEVKEKTEKKDLTL